MAWRCTGRNNEEMVDKFVHVGIITSKEVEDAFRLIPRGAFVPSEIQDEAYIDAPIRGDPHVHMSAPHMYATILEALDLQPGFSFLNIGSGTGYFSSLAGYVLKRGAVNHGVEVYEDLIEFAHERLEEFLRYSPQVCQEFCHPKFICGNCFCLDPSDRKYDRVYSGAACPTSKVSTILQLTKIGGFAIVPCRNKLLKLERLSASQVRQTVIGDVCFASLVLPSDSETSLPKIKFPESEQKLKKKIRPLPPRNIIVSRSKARKALSKLRALQEAVECLKCGSGIPLPFCYVPCQNQIQSLVKKPKSKQIKSSAVNIPSPVDSKISFFSLSVSSSSSTRTFGEDSNGHGNHFSNSLSIPALESSAQTESDIWDYLASDTLWQTVLEHYYSICNTSNERKKKALKVYIRKGKRIVSEAKKYPSFADIAKKMGLIPFSTPSSLPVFNEKVENNKGITELSSENKLDDHTMSGDDVTNNTSAYGTSNSFDNNSAEKRVDTSKSFIFPGNQTVEGLSMDGNKSNQTSAASQKAVKEPGENLSATSCAPEYSETKHKNDQLPCMHKHSEIRNDDCKSSFTLEAPELEKKDNRSSCISESSGLRKRDQLPRTLESLEVVKEFSYTSKSSEAENNDRLSYIPESSELKSYDEKLFNISESSDKRNDDRLSLTSVSSELKTSDNELPCAPKSSVMKMKYDDLFPSIPVSQDLGKDDDHMPCVLESTKLNLKNGNQLNSAPDFSDIRKDSHLSCTHDGSELRKNDENLTCKSSSSELGKDDSHAALTPKCLEMAKNDPLPCKPPLLELKKRSDQFSCAFKFSGLQNNNRLTCSVESPESKNHCYQSSCSPKASDLEKDDRLLIATDQELVDKLAAAPPGDWKLREDYELAQFLSNITQKSNKGRCKGWFRCELVRPEIFAKEDIMGYPRIASYSPDKLAYRTTVLCRIAKVLDSVLFLLSGPSLLKEQPFVNGKNTLDAFNESSFISTKCISESELLLSTKVSHSVKLPAVDKVENEAEYSKDLECIRCKQQLVLKKIKLTQALQDQYKEQQKLLKKQIRLVDEQQQLLQNIHVHDFTREEQRKDSLSDLQLNITELKGQKFDLVAKQQHLIEQQGEQDCAKTDLLTRLRKLKEDEQRLLHNGMRKKSIITLPEGRCNMEGPVNTGVSISSERKLGKKESSTGTHPVSLRFHLSQLLPQVRFLLPLCQQRWRIVQGLLQSSELPSPDHMPVITVDRRLPLSSRSVLSHSVVMQVYKELRVEGLHFRWNKRKYDQWWEVKFVGEGIIDQGGGFRDSVAEMADELCPPGETEEVLPFFIKTPNNRDRVGDYLDGYIPNPSCNNVTLLNWIGKLMGAMFRSDESLTLSFPPFVWKLLVGEHVTWSHDYIFVDEAAVKITDDLEVMEEESYEETYGALCNFTTVLSNGVREELVPNGETKPVTSQEREKFAALVRRKRMTESTNQILAIREGLASVIPESALNLLTWKELERAVCGDPDISVSVLKSACQYGDDLSESSLCVQYMWTAIARLTVEERSRFLRFVTGRKRPPAPFTVSKASGDLDCLPNASTCGSTLFLPDYTTAAIATEKLRYAIYNCVAIDTDTSPW